MSAYSTLRITRKSARLQALATVALADDALLADILDAVLRERLYNCRIVDDTDENDDEEAFP
jgi:hypothetical protein